MITLYGTFQGTHESLWSMEVEEQDWQEYLQNNPDFDSNDPEHMEKMWDYFKWEKKYYDAPEESVDLENTISLIEAYKEGKNIFNA